MLGFSFFEFDFSLQNTINCGAFITSNDIRNISQKNS